MHKGLTQIYYEEETLSLALRKRPKGPCCIFLKGMPTTYPTSETSRNKAVRLIHGISFFKLT